MSAPTSSQNSRQSPNRVAASGPHDDSIANENEDVVAAMEESELGVEFSETLAQNTVDELKRPSQPSFMIGSILRTDCTLREES